MSIANFKNTASLSISDMRRCKVKGNSYRCIQCDRYRVDQLKTVRWSIYSIYKITWINGYAVYRYGSSHSPHLRIFAEQWTLHTHLLKQAAINCIIYKSGMHCTIYTILSRCMLRHMLHNYQLTLRILQLY